MILLLWFYKRLNLISEVKLFINKVDIIDNMKDLYIGYYPITELEIKELMKLIISYKKYDYNNVLKTLKKLNCTSKQQDYVNTILSNCMLNKNTDFFDTQYGFYIAQLQKLYRKHFTMENVSHTQLLNRMHSLNVYSQLKKLCKWYECNASNESIAIVSLFHDLCKIGCYKQVMKWRKDKNSQWEQYATYTFEEDFAYGGHGAKSVFLVQSFMQLTPEEASAINCHMGQWDATTYSNPTEVYRRNRLAWLLHVADEAADFILDFILEERRGLDEV